LTSALLILSCLVACEDAFVCNESMPTLEMTATSTHTKSIRVTMATTPDLDNYAFPVEIDPHQRYLFYIHGKIIEDQGFPAVSPDFGEYQYAEILVRLSDHGFVVVSEQRPKNADVQVFGKLIADQVERLLDAGVPGESITLIGASKGAAITMYASFFLQNPDLNFVIMGICHPEVISNFKNDQVVLYGNVLSIYDDSDEYAGSCQELFTYSSGKGLSTYDELILNIGTGHGILYKPLDEWIIPAVNWAKDKYP
jgi:hypothetical protein